MTIRRKKRPSPVTSEGAKSRPPRGFVVTYVYRGIDAFSNDFVETIDGEPKLTER